MSMSSVQAKTRFRIAYEESGNYQTALKAAGIKDGTHKAWCSRDPGHKAWWLDARERYAVRLRPGDSAKWPSDDFLAWRESCCAYLDHRSKRWVRAQNNWYQRDAYKQLSEHNRLVIILPPGHIKTTMFAIEYPTWNIMRDRNFRALIVQKNEKEAQKVVGAVKERLGDSSYYDFINTQLVAQREVGITNPLTRWFKDSPFRGGARGDGLSWGAQSFRVMGRTSGEKDASMQAIGVGGQIQGIRADLIVLDDIQDPDLAVKSPQDSNDKAAWFNNVILGRVTDDQKVVVLANYFSPDDFAHRIVAEHPDWPVIEYPAWIDASVDPEIPEGERRPLCPEFWTPEGLEKKEKEVGSRTWFFTWMQEAGSFDEQTFKREALEAAINGEYALGDVPYDVTDVFIGVDPAIAATGHCAMIAWGLDRRTKQRYLIDIFNKTGMRNWETVIAQIEEWLRAYDPYALVIEGNNTQQGFINSDSLKRAVRSHGVKRFIIYQTVTGVGARAESTNFDITTVGALFDEGLITLPAQGDFQSQERLKEYIDQLSAWRTDEFGHSIKHLKRDMVMATLFAESEAFLRAKSERSDRKPRNTTPRWATNTEGGFSWMGRKRNKHIRYRDEVAKRRKAPDPDDLPE